MYYKDKEISVAIATKSMVMNLMNDHISAALKSSPLFSTIPPDAIKWVISCLQPKISNYAKGTYIALEGESFNGLGIIINGKGTTVKENAAGTRIVMSTVEAGDMFGEMIVFSTRENWPFSVYAQTDCQVMFLSSVKIIGTCANICSSHKQIITNLLTVISEKAIMLNRKVEYLSFKGMREKICTYLLEQHKLQGTTTFTTLNRNDMADFFNVSRTALSREMGRMRDEGLIDFYRSSIKIINLEALKKVIE